MTMIPTREAFIRSLSEQDKSYLYKHFEGAAHPDELIYLAWLWANGWIDDPEVKTEWIIDPKTNEEVGIEVLDLDQSEPSLRILFEFWKMDEVLHLLRNKS